MHLSAGLALVVARVFESIYYLLRIRSRPLLTRHAVYISFRDQGYAIYKAQQDFGFKSRIMFKEGIELTLTWLKSEEGRRCISA